MRRIIEPILLFLAFAFIVLMGCLTAKGIEWGDMAPQAPIDWNGLSPAGEAEIAPHHDPVTKTGGGSESDSPPIPSPPAPSAYTFPGLYELLKDWQAKGINTDQIEWNVKWVGDKWSLVYEKVPEPEVKQQLPMQPAMMSAKGHWERQCGRNGCTQVWVSDK